MRSSFIARGLCNRLLKQVKNGLFLFDTNVLSPDNAYYLTKCIDSFKHNNSAAIVAVNRTEPDVLGALVRYVDDAADFELDSRLTQTECDRVNNELDRLGVCRTFPTETNML